MKITDSLLPEFDQEMANTRKTLERIPDDKLAWKPHPKSFSMGSLGTHIANMTGWLTDTIAKDSFDIAPGRCPALQRRTGGFRQRTTRSIRQECQGRPRRFGRSE